MGVQSEEYVRLPGFCDVHVHFREPGFSYKGTVKTGTLAAARGGYTCVCTMPNLDPVPDSLEHLQLQLDIIKKDALIPVIPYGSITVGEKGLALSEIEALAPHVIGYSDDGIGLNDTTLMREAMLRAKACGKIIAAHCEDASLKKDGYIHAGNYAKRHGHKGIVRESEWQPIKRDIALAKETGCAYHVCHVSCRESVEIVRQAKAEGINVSCETAPHYLLLTDEDLQEDGRFKMNPPIRERADKEALIEGLLDGTIDMIATDHAPHSEEEKAQGLACSCFGIVGLEVAFPLLYTELVRTGILTLERLTALMSTAPRARFHIPEDKADSYTVWDLTRAYTIDPSDFVSMGRATPFAGKEVYGVCMETVINGKQVYHA